MWPRRRRRASADSSEATLREAISSTLLPRHDGFRHVAVMGPKGGAGKTPTSATLGLNLAALRGEITAVADGNTHLGTLRRRLVDQAEVGAPLPLLELAGRAAAGHLQPEWGALSPYSDLVERLRVFSNTGVDPALVENMPGEDYTSFLRLVTRAAQLVVSDMGTSTAGEVAIAALDAADQLIVCTSMQRDQLELVIEWMSALWGDPVSYSPEPADYSSVDDGRYRELVSRAIVVVAPGGGDPRDLKDLLDWTADLTSAGRAGGRVVVVPQDPHVALGERLSLAELQPATRVAYLKVAELVVDNFRLPKLAWRNQADLQVHVHPALAASGPARPVPLAPVAPAAPCAGAADLDAVTSLLKLTDGEREAVAGWSGNPIDVSSAGSGLAMGLGATTDAVPAVLPAGAQANSAVAGQQVGNTQHAAVTGVVAKTARFAMGLDLGAVLYTLHTEGETCRGCSDPACTWPTTPGLEPSS